jgi:hypothetical protein
MFLNYQYRTYVYMLTHTYTHRHRVINFRSLLKQANKWIILADSILDGVVDSNLT